MKQWKREEVQTKRRKTWHEFLDLTARHFIYYPAVFLGEPALIARVPTTAPDGKFRDLRASKSVD